MTKARDIIPGWPRGRSTSRPIEIDTKGLSLFDYKELCVFEETDELTVFGVDHRWKQDWSAKEIERRRKADMMEAWRLAQMADVEKQKPSRCPGCGNDGRAQFKLSVFQRKEYWCIRCTFCLTEYLQDFYGITHLLACPNSENEWEGIVRL